MGMLTSLQYGAPVIKYDRKGFKARQRQLILTQKAAYVVELAKIKQKIEYSALKGKCQATMSHFQVGSTPGHTSDDEACQWDTQGRMARLRPGLCPLFWYKCPLHPAYSNIQFGQSHLPQ